MHDAYEDYAVWWVCSNCYWHANYAECGDCTEEGHEFEPLGKVGDIHLWVGIPSEGHSEGCREDEDLGHCDCEHKDSSSSSCDGCGSYYQGQRYAMTEFV